ncbi:MAG: hypothetical protein IJW87_04975 [Clostridia bacterium]|nr:hypothetical protein [Clostridia bacterium]
MKKIRYINKEIVNIENLEYEDHKISNNGLRCPKLNAHNIRAIHEYVVNQSSYSSGSGDDFVRKYFQQHRGDVSLASVITKVILIDTVDSTNLKQLLGKDYFKIVAQRIIDANLEEIIKNGDRLGDTFRRVASFPAKKDAKKEDLNLFVFLSKYITRVNQYSYGRDDYSIMDRVVKDNLKHFNSDDTPIPDVESLRIHYQFDEYCDIFKPILEKYPEITREMIDHFIWFTFKEEAVGDK